MTFNFLLSLQWTLGSQEGNYIAKKSLSFCLICIISFLSIIENKTGFAESNDDSDNAIYDDNNAYYFEININETEL